MPRRNFGEWDVKSNVIYTREITYQIAYFDIHIFKTYMHMQKTNYSINNLFDAYQVLISSRIKF